MEGVESGKLWTDFSGFGFYSYGLGFRYTVVVLLFISAWKLFLKLSSSFFRRRASDSAIRSKTNSRASSSSSSLSASSSSQTRSSAVVSEIDLRKLVDDLDDKLDMNDGWENVIDKRNDSISYSAKCCKQKDGPIKYLSVTVFEGCSPEILRDFYMDNDYRKTWDKTLIDHRQLEVDVGSGTEIGQMVKKFPLLTPREYVLAWRLWEGKNQSFYCFSKECEHPMVPRQKKYVRVGYFRSGWRISKVPGRDACEIRMVHQEDSGLNVEMAKLAFARGIWSYVCKMDNALRKYSPRNHVAVSPAVSAITLIQKVPSELDNTENFNTPSPAEFPNLSPVCRQVAHDQSPRKLSRRPSGKLIANGLVLLGGAICLSRGRHADLGLHFLPAAYKGFRKSKAIFSVKAGKFTLVTNFSPALEAHASGDEIIVKEFCVNIKENHSLDIVFSPYPRAKSKDIYAFVK